MPAAEESLAQMSNAKFFFKLKLKTINFKLTQWLLLFLHMSYGFHSASHVCQNGISQC